MSCAVLTLSNSAFQWKSTRKLYMLRFTTHMIIWPHLKSSWQKPMPDKNAVASNKKNWEVRKTKRSP